MDLEQGRNIKITKNRSIRNFIVYSLNQAAILLMYLIYRKLLDDSNPQVEEF